jgi:hypothetical protein
LVVRELHRSWCGGKGGRRNVEKVRLTYDELALVWSTAAAANLTMPHLLVEAVLGWIVTRGQLLEGPASGQLTSFRT